MTGKQAIIALNAVTTDRVINLLLVDGTKDDWIFKALQKRLVDSQVSFDVTELDRYLDRNIKASHGGVSL